MKSFAAVEPGSRSDQRYAVVDIESPRPGNHCDRPATLADHRGQNNPAQAGQLAGGTSGSTRYPVYREAVTRNPRRAAGAGIPHVGARDTAGAVNAIADCLHHAVAGHLEGIQIFVTARHRRPTRTMQGRFLKFSGTVTF